MKILHSLRWRIQLWHGAFLFAVLLGLGIAAWRYEQASGRQRIDSELRKRTSILLDSLPRRENQGPPGDRPPPREGPEGPPEFENDRPPPGRGRPGPGGPGGPGGGRFRLPDEFAALFGGESGFYYVFWREDGEVMGKSPNAPAGISFPKRPPPGQAVLQERDRGAFRESSAFTPRGDCFVTGCSTAALDLALRKYLHALIAIETAILLLGLGGGWWATSRSLRPLRAITATANEIADGHLDQRIAVKDGTTELGELAVLLNHTFGKLETSFARQAQFTSDAAHELRTPLSVVISQAQLALRGNREAAEYREMFEASLRAARRMQKLTQSLLELARLDNANTQPDRQPNDLATLAKEALSIVDLAASERGITFVEELHPAPCAIDADAMIRVILNLLANAIEHSPENSPIRIETHLSGNSAILSVTDHGGGIAPQHLTHLFDRFYRADQSRNRKTGGTGLGLAICKSIVAAHNGSLSVESEVGKGSTFTLRI